MLEACSILRAEIIAIGTELVMGELVDTNSNYLASQLPNLGIELIRMSQIKDERDELVNAFNQALSRSDLIITTGGLGPTDDDITREAVSDFCSEEMYIDQDSLMRIEEIFNNRGIEMSPTNIKQANLIPSATSIRNEIGTAPGWWVKKFNKDIIAMPGPPREMHEMWRNHIYPKLEESYSGFLIYTLNIRTHGLGESGLNERVSGILQDFGLDWGMYAQPFGVDIRLRLRSPSQEEAKKSLSTVEAKLNDVIGNFIWGLGYKTVEERVAECLVDNKLTVSVMESCTGGLLSNTLTQIPGSSNYFEGGLVTYTPEMKKLFGVDKFLINQYGTVSAEVAMDMSRTVRKLLGSDIGLSVTGVAGPDKLENKPVGTVFIGLSSSEGTSYINREFAQQRAVVKQRATTEALMYLLNFVR